MSQLNRRQFLGVLGFGGASLSLAGCGNTSIDSGVETVESYVEPEDFNIPGVGVYYASTCTQCASGCGIVGRVREGRVLKLEGNRESSINGGRLCGLGQAAVQHHYNPDRLRQPLLRQGGVLKAVDWNAAMAALTQRTHAAAGRFAFMTGPLSGHLKVLVQNFTGSLGSTDHYVYEPLSNRVNHVAAERLFGSAAPQLRLDQAQLIVSFGADFLDTWVSPVNFSGEYARFRKGREDKARGVLVQIEPRMTLTGANADRWIAIRPGTEGVLALGLANALLQGAHPSGVAAAVASAAAPYDKARVLAQTGVSADAFDRLVALLRERTPSVVLSGPSAEGHAHGSRNALAILALNHVLGNAGKTVLPAARPPFEQIAPDAGDSASLKRFADSLAAGAYQTVFLHDVNPLYTAPDFLKLRDAFNKDKGAFKVTFAHYLDETATASDLVLPLDSDLEGWGTHLAFYQPGAPEMTLQQPLMEKLYPEGTRSLGDVLLDLLRTRRPDEYKAFPDYYAYLKSALTRNKGAFETDTVDADTFWSEALSHGVLKFAAVEETHKAEAHKGEAHKAEAHKAARSTKGVAEAPSVRLEAGDLEMADAGAPAADSQYPFRLAPAVRSGLRDGRHANLPWMQETPDSLTTIVWDSWAEIHPKTAERLGIQEGDIVEIASASGSLKVQAYLFPGLHPDVIGVPLGQGHQGMGRYADGRGVNPFKILDPVFDRATGELAMYATRIKLARTGETVRVVKDEGWKSGTLKTQEGRKLVVTLTADKAQLAKEV
jgi:anaerobic selenocysteine-containing dehydrogenase